MRSRFGQLRFGIANLLLATLWAAAWLTVCLHVDDLDRATRRGVAATFLLAAPLAMFLVAGPFAVLNALFLRTRFALGVGFLLALLTAVLVTLASFHRLV
jgi:hypothetical protein